MGTKSPGGPQRCRIILQHCLAIQLTKPGHTPDDFWMYDSGYMIFQNFLAANAQCWWNSPLTAATKALRYAGHIAPGMLLVTAEPCALEVLRGAYARSVLKPPATYVISSVGDIDDCIVAPTVQGQFTPLTEALCDVIMDLTSLGQSATIENIRVKLTLRFPHMQQPSSEMIYDTLAQLMQEGKIYQTSKGYFIVTPERRRSRSRPRGHHRSYEVETYDNNTDHQEIRTMLMSNSEALHSLYGEISTERDGDLTHQCIQTNLADVICGGNPNDKILYPRTSKRRSASFPTPRSLERRHSLRLFGSSKRLQRCQSTRSLSKNYAQTLLGTESSSSEYQSTDSSSPKKGSLLSRLFRRSGRSKQRQLETYSAQFPPAEWFNSRAVHLHSVGTQTVDHDMPVAHTLSNSTFYDGSELSSQRSSTLPRRHRRHMSSESTFVISSRDCSPIRRRSPGYCSGSLPRSTHSIPAANKVQKMIASKQIADERNRMAAKSGDVFRSSPIRRNELDNKIMNEREKHYRHMQSGPSSLESGKASILTSGPSSFDSGKISFSRTSGHSSLESQTSANTVATMHSPSRSILTNGSPSNSPLHQSPKIKVGSDYSFNRQRTSFNNSKGTEESPSRTMRNPPQVGIPNSNSNSSITLQVTTNSQNNHIPSTKIYVQNSPVRSVITLENGKLMENSNVFIINNETMTNSNGDIIKRNISKQNMPMRSAVHHRDHDKENYFSENEIASETCDSISMISENSPESSLIPVNKDGTTDILENSKFTKNINNDATMNNSRKLSLQIPNQTGNITYKNVLKNVPGSNPTSPINNKNIYLFEGQRENTYDQIAGSVGNLRCFEKNSLESHKIGSQNKLNSNCDLKNMQFETTSGNLLKKCGTLNSNPAINSDSLAQILHKNIVAVGSEPNLAHVKNIEQNKKTFLEKAVDKETVDRRFSLSKENTDDLYNFPSLTDLSFNFTSLAAQKILQGVSINSIDTLVELNMANNTQEKQQNNNVSSVCTDYGMV